MTLPSLKYIESAPGKIVPLNKLKSKRAELISEQKRLRSRYYYGKNEEKKLYAIKRNVDTMLGKPRLENQLRRSKQR